MKYKKNFKIYFVKFHTRRRSNFFGILHFLGFFDEHHLGREENFRLSRYKVDEIRYFEQI